MVTLWQRMDFEYLSSFQLYQFMQLREKVFVVEQNCAYLDADGKDLVASHLMGWKNNHLIAYARLLPPGVSYQEASIGRFVTDESVRKAGVGKALMKMCIEALQHDFPGVGIRISAQEYLRDFYESFGFQQQGVGYLEDGIPHIEMLR